MKYDWEGWGEDYTKLEGIIESEGLREALLAVSCSLKGSGIVCWKVEITEHVLPGGTAQ